MSDFYSVPPLRMPVGVGNGLTRGKIKIHNSPKPAPPKPAKKK
jgi:hypothetical protein